jgi:hypothetical protein
MRGRAFNLLAGISLLLFAATMVFWVRSYSVTDNPVRYTLEQRGKYWVVRGYSVVSADGMVRVHRSGWLATYKKYPWDSSTEKFHWWTLPWYDIGDRTQVLLPATRLPDFVNRDERGLGEWTVTFPYWSAAVVFALLPMWWLKKRLFRKKNGRGFEVATKTAV